MSAKLRRIGGALALVVLVGFVIRMTQLGHVAVALVVGCVGLVPRWSHRAGRLAVHE